MAKLSDINLLSIGNTIQLAGAIYVGEGRMYLAMFPEEQGGVYDNDGNDCVDFIGDDGQLSRAETLNMGLDDWTAFLRQTDLLETEVLAKAADGAITKAIIRKSQRQIDQGVSWKVFKRDGYACRYCGVDDVPLTVDHLVCWEAGGPSTQENLVAACRKCNKTRGDLSFEDWLKHPYYLKVSKRLDEATRNSNLNLVATLATIPLVTHKRSR